MINYFSTLKDNYKDVYWVKVVFVVFSMSGAHSLGFLSYFPKSILPYVFADVSVWVISLFLFYLGFSYFVARIIMFGIETLFSTFYSGIMTPKPTSGSLLSSYALLVEKYQTAITIIKYGCVYLATCWLLSRLYFDVSSHQESAFFGALMFFVVFSVWVIVNNADGKFLYWFVTCAVVFSFALGVSRYHSVIAQPFVQYEDDYQQGMFNVIYLDKDIAIYRDNDLMHLKTGDKQMTVAFKRP
jgi:low affinity Fe/Cu permease